MRRLLTHAAGPLPVEGLDAFPEPMFASVGDHAPFVVCERTGPQWIGMTLGVLTRDVGSATRIASAREDLLDTVERWCLMAPRRCALPIRGYRWTTEADWVNVEPLWAPCIYEDDKHLGTGAVLIANAGAGYVAPILMDAVTVGLWLTLPLRGAQDLLPGRRAAA